MFYYIHIYPPHYTRRFNILYYIHSNLSFTFRTHYVYFFTNLETNTKHTIPTGQTAVRVTGNFSFLTMCAHAGYRPNIFTCTQALLQRRADVVVVVICIYTHTHRGPHNIIIHMCVCVCVCVHNNTQNNI